MDQERNPSTWHVLRPTDPADRLQCWCKIACHEFGFVGVDVKSHQQGEQIPHPAIVQGNEAQDEHCGEARTLRRPADVAIPSGGFFAFLSVEGRMVTSPAATALRRILREQAAGKWASRPVQGKIGRIHSGLCKAALDP